MKYTANYNLKKPEGADLYNIEDFNGNADIIDGALKSLAAGALAVSYDGEEQAIVFGTGGGTGTADEAAVAAAAELNNGVTAAIAEVSAAYSVTEEDVDEALAEVGV